MIHIQNLSKSFNNSDFVVNNVNLTIASGEVLVLLGSSGSGKSTLLKTINRLIIPSSGNVFIDGKDTKDIDPLKLRRNIGYVFQRIGLFPHLTISDNLTICLRLVGISKATRKRRAYQLLELIGLSPSLYANRYPNELSGGEQQRVGVARALASESKYLLMDEPFGALDAITRTELQEEILRIKKEFKKTIIFVTHDIFESLKLGDRIAVMHEGKIDQIDTGNNLISHPKTDFVSNLVANWRSQTTLIDKLS